MPHLVRRQTCQWIALASLAFCASTPSAMAQAAYPSKPITLVVTYPPGGGADAMARLMKVQDFHALDYEGDTYDCGDAVGLLRANVAYALKHKTMGAAARAAIEGLL